MKRTKLNDRHFKPEHLKIVEAIARKVQHDTGHDFDDLYSEACLAYCLVRKKYDPAEYKTKFSTFLLHTIKNHLRTYLWSTWRINHKPYKYDPDWVPFEHVELSLIYEDEFEIASVPASNKLRSALSYIVTYPEKYIDPDKRINKEQMEADFGEAMAQEISDIFESETSISTIFRILTKDQT